MKRGHSFIVWLFLVFGIAGIYSEDEDVSVFENTEFDKEPISGGIDETGYEYSEIVDEAGERESQEEVKSRVPRVVAPDPPGRGPTAAEMERARDTAETLRLAARLRARLERERRARERAQRGHTERAPSARRADLRDRMNRARVKQVKIVVSPKHASTNRRNYGVQNP